MANTDFIYEMITNKVIERLEQGVVPWRKPWTEHTMPRSINGHVYRGVNVFILLAAGYESPYWLTRNEINKRGGRIREGEQSTVIIFWKILRVRDKENPDEVKTIPHLQYFRVWNFEQVENVAEPKGGAFPNRNQDATNLVAEDRHAAAAAIVDGYPNPPTISHKGKGAFYYPGPDLVEVPSLVSFSDLDEYYSTLFHELGHSTCHESRLNRQSDYVFGSHSYGREELVAEMVATFLTSEAGIVSTFDNSAAYLGAWIRTIKEDPKAIIKAGAQAQRAADYILGRTPKTATTEDDSSSKELALAS